MHRSKRGELAKLRGEMVRCRLLVAAAREEMIEALGDFMCGSGAAPGVQDIRALDRLCEALEEAEAAYARRLAAPPEPHFAGLRQRVG
ncbi:hypothetical protein AB4Z46_09160 [Variovorax sp. M-6]|uniref:hypothetical protein n=1 Tax=Variovorax sp. M-6 TaxID=3233041 RepID=UPI003F9C1B29